MTTTGELSEDLRSVIDRYLDGHRSRSLATLSRSSGVSYTTIRRLYQREGNPTAEPVLKILDASATTEEKVQFINKHYPEIGTALGRCQPGTFSPAARLDTLKTFYLRDPHNFILNLAHTEHGTTQDVVRRLTGERGVEALEELIEHEILEIHSQVAGVATRYRLAPQLSHDCDMALAQMKLSADHFDRSLIGTKAARLFHATGGVNQKTLERIHDIVSNAIKDVVSLKDDPRSTGDIPFFVDMMMNVYDKTSLQRDRSDG